MSLGTQSILNPDPPQSEERTLSARFRKRLANDWNQAREQYRAIFSGRTAGWWIGFVVTFVLLVLVSAMFEIELRNMALFLTVLGGAAGHWISMRLRSYREDVTHDPVKAAGLYRVMLVIGVILFVVNILPDYRENVFGSGGGYVWSTNSSILAGIGAAMALLALLLNRDNRRD